MKVLVADDDPIARCLLDSWLTEWGYEVVLAKNGLEAKRALDIDPTLRLAVVDCEMPEMVGEELCRAVRSGPHEPYIYIILISARDATSDVVEGLSAGADDYITKPCHRHELEVRLRTGRRILELQEQLIKARDMLKHEAMHDGLTGVYNRGAILETLGRELSRARREDNPVAVLMVDLDHFKSINDTHGHHVGDAVIIEAAHKMKGTVRDYDSVGRIGGEEFLIVLPGCDSRRAEQISERLLRAIAGAKVHARTGVVRVSLSAGVASTDRSKIASAESLLRAADLALYRAKRGGRARAEVASVADWATVAEDIRTRSGEHPAVSIGA